MKTRVTAILIIALGNICCFSQEQYEPGTIVPLEFVTTVSSKGITVGQLVELRVRNDIKIQDKVIIHFGSIARAKIISVQKAKGCGVAGRIELVAQDVIVNRLMIPMTSEVLIRVGKNRKGLAWGLTLGTFIIIPPLNFLFLRTDVRHHFR